MRKLKKFNQMFEADIKDNSGVNDDYLQSIEDRAMEAYGDSGLSREEQQEIGGLFHNIFRMQQGHEEELTEIGKEIIMGAYGSILDGVELDLKIVRPDDSEKREMVDKMFDEPNKRNEEPDSGVQSDNIEIETEVDVDEVDKRKILNNIMQGESQNVHTMLFNKKDEIDNISSGLVENSLRFLELNEKIMWDTNRPPLEEMMKNMPDMANAVEVDWEDDENEDGEKETKPVIKVRALELTMILHETVKGIYELIMANAIPSDPAMAEKVLAETDSVKDEDQDIKYGKFIATDLRDYINRFLEDNYPAIKGVDNIREFIYGGLAEMNARTFLDFMKKALTGDNESADRILKNSNIVEDIMKSFDDFENQTDDDEYIDIDGSDDEYTGVSDDEPTEVRYIDMSPSELEKELNKALDNDDFATAKEIGKYMNK